MLTQPKTLVYKIVQDCEIRADLYCPPTGSGPAPIIVYIHGGALINGSRRDIRPRQLQLYLDSGYAVVSIDYRLAPETKLPLIIEDLQDAFRWVEERRVDLFHLDSDRIAVVGHSAGGYLTLMAGFCVSPRPRALVSFYGYGDIAGDWYSKPDPFYCRAPAVSEEESGIFVHGPVISEPYEGRGKEQFYLYCRQQGLWPQEVTGHDPESEPSFFRPYCPVLNVSRDYPPTFLLHGNKDTDVPYQQSVMMAKELTRVGVENKLITITDGPHGFDGQMDAPQVKSAFEVVLRFLEQHLAA